MRIAAVSAGICLSLVGLCSAQAVKAAAERIHTSIPPEALGTALKQFAQARDMQVLYFSAAVEDLRTQGAAGDLTADETLKRLLSGTGLTYRYVNEHKAVTIVPGGPAGAASSPLSLNGAKSGSFGSGVSDKGTKGGGPATGPFRVAQMDRRKAEGDAALVQGNRPGAGSAVLEEVMVTAQKYRQSAFDVPISMTVIGGPGLQRLGITDLNDLQFYVPGFYVDNNGNSIEISLRGVSNLFGQGALVGTYLDEADVTNLAGGGLNLATYDLARVEVLKGPQRTLYGEGSVGGTVRYIINQPVLDEFQMGADVTALFDQYGAPESRVDAVLNVPVVNDVAGLRIAAHLDDGGGWVDQPAVGLKNIDSKNLADVRMLGRWRPEMDFTIDALQVIHRARSGPLTGETQVGVYNQTFNLMTTPSLENDYNISNVTLQWQPGALTVVDSATYFTYFIDEHNFGAAYQLTQPPSQPIDYYYPSFPARDESASNELRVSGAEAGWHWMVGGFFKRISQSTPPSPLYFGFPGPPGAPLPAPFTSSSDIHSNSKSVFIDTNYRMFEALVLGVGARYFRDDESGLLVGDTQREKARFTSTDPRFYARYGISRDVNVYASAAKGFRSGGFNGLGYPQYQPEHVWTYELGAKARLLNNRLSLDSDVFLSSYGAYQIVGLLPQPNPPQDITRNAGNVRMRGVESEVTWSAGKRWRLGVSGDYINARFVSIAVIGSSYDVGDPLDFVPRYQVTASAEREVSWLGRSGFARIDYTQRAMATYRNRSIGPWYYSQSDYMHLLGFRYGIDWTKSPQLGVFARNLLNDRGYTGPEAIQSHAAREQPRTFGLYFRAGVE